MPSESASLPQPRDSGFHAAPALVPAPGGALMADADGAVRRVELPEARAAFKRGNALVAHALFVAGRLK